MIGQTVSKYRVVDLIGEGGMGVVYRAEDLRLGRSVALKFLPAGVVRDEAARARFLNEARAASALQHRNVCVVHDIAETEDGRLYIIMPFYSGESLESRVARGPLRPPEAVEVLLQVGAGLATAHGKGILHRDLKPGNVFLTDDGEVKILDFGVAKLADAAGMTRTGGVVGTLSYMSPEQLRDEGADVRTEIWALGVILYEVLTAKLPFAGRTQAALVTSILRGRPDLVLLRRLAGERLGEIVRRCLRRWPEHRYASVDELTVDLEAARAAADWPDPLTVGTATGEDSLPTQDLLTPAARMHGPSSRSAIPEAAEERRVDEPVAAAPAGPPAAEPRPGGPPRTTSGLVVGREAELGRLSDWLAAGPGAGPRLALVRGEEGRGKSTLVAELCRRSEDAGGFVSASGSCGARSPAGDPYVPFREILGQLTGEHLVEEFGGRRTHVHVARLQRLVPTVVRELVASGPDLIGTFVAGPDLLERARGLSSPGSPWVEDLEDLLASERAGGARPEVPRAELFDQLGRVFDRVAEVHPLLLVVEDLHRADEGTADLVSWLARRGGSAPLYLVGTLRHEEVTLVPGRERHPFEPVLHELIRSVDPLEIDLDDTDGAGFVDALVDAEPNRLDREFRRQLFRFTGGLPLFTSELLRELRDAGVLVRDGEGRWVVEGRVDWELLPRRVEAVVADRVGRLPADLRRVLTTASVQGDEFIAEVVARVLDLDERETLRRLSNEAARQFRMVAATGVRRVGPHRQSLYRFRHALFRRYLYESLDRVELTLHHEDAALEIERLYGEQEHDVVALLAHHYREAGITEKAVEYLRRAGRRAVRLAAPAEAERLSVAALETLSGLPPGRERSSLELEVLTALISVRTAIHGFGSEEVQATYLRARELCEQLPEASDFLLLWGLFAFSSVRGEIDRAHPLAERMLVAAEAGDDPAQLVQGHYALGVTEFLRGHLPGAAEHFGAAAASDGEGLAAALTVAFSQDSRRAAAAYRSWALWLAGEFEASLEGARDAVARARGDAHPFTLSTVLLLTGFVRALAGEADAAREQGEEMAALSNDYGLFQHAEAELLQGLAAVVESPTVVAVERLSRALATYRDREWAVFVPFLLGLSARARWLAGDREGAEGELREALVISEEGGERFWLAELLRLRAELAEDRADAVADLQRALELARTQGATWLELRSARSLARLAADPGPLADVVDRLAPDPEPRDLREGRRELAELG